MRHYVFPLQAQVVSHRLTFEVQGLSYEHQSRLLLFSVEKVSASSLSAISSSDFTRFSIPSILICQIRPSTAQARTLWNFLPVRLRSRLRSCTNPGVFGG